MLPKKILVATDGSEYAFHALQTALSMAEKLSSSIGLLYVVNIRKLEGPFLSDLSGVVGVVPFLNFQKQVSEVLCHKGEAVLDNYLELCKQRGVPATKELSEGIVSRIICQAAKSYDLICLGKHGEHAPWSGIMMGSTVEEVVRGSSRPVLVSPGGGQKLKRLLIPYDGSQTSSTSLALAVEMAANLGASISVLCVTKDPEEGRQMLEEARKFIEPRKIKVEFIHKTGEPVPSIIEAAEDNFDMVVMGAYGHSRLKVLFLGSTTAGVLNKINIPVLLYR